MLPDQIKNFRDIVVLKDGTSILLRPMVIEDKEGLEELFLPVSEEDMRYLQDNVRDPALVETWCKNLDYNRVLPLLAICRNRIVGEATLHFRKGPKRHIAEVRIFLSKEFRRRGLGTKMLNTLIDLARRQGLRLLVAEVVADQSKVIKAFQNLGFSLYCTYDDYFMLPDGDTRDVTVLLLDLQPKSDLF
jgi:L-amino acid N-acyltransferase YncA